MATSDDNMFALAQMFDDITINLVSREDYLVAARHAGEMATSCMYGEVTNVQKSLAWSAIAANLIEMSKQRQTAAQLAAPLD